MVYKVSTYGVSKFFGEFVAHLLCWYRTAKIKDPESGKTQSEAIWMRMVSLPDAFYFHFLVSYLIGAATYQLWLPAPSEELALVGFIVFLIVLHTRFLDLTLKLLGIYGLVVALLVLADNGLRMSFPEVLPRGVLRPVLYDFPLWLDVYGSSGLMYLIAILLAGYIGYHCFWAVLDRRYELDERDLHIKSLTGGGVSKSIPRFARPVTRRVRDILEWMSGCADMIVDIGNNRTIVIKNVFGLAWWGKKPYLDLSYSTARRQRELKESGVNAHEDVADLVEPFKEHHHDHDHDHAHDHETEQQSSTVDATSINLEGEKDDH